jgi:hypothetical protein
MALSASKLDTPTILEDQSALLINYMTPINSLSQLPNSFRFSAVIPTKRPTNAIPLSWSLPECF